MKCKKYLLIPLMCLVCLITSCHTSKKTSDLQSKGLSVADPYMGVWDFIVKDTPSGDAEGVIEIERIGASYRALLDSEIGKVELDQISIKDEYLKGHFRYKGFRVNVKGTFDDNTLSGKLAVTLVSFPLEATRRAP
ncbi:MAG: hypothetical protein HKN87_03365 [Saprospiraceae bacterium]|nr:hypothetical protein [Saprospiraceae bacterium]